MGHKVARPTRFFEHKPDRTARDQIGGHLVNRYPFDRRKVAIRG